jgi:hypothetical protein
MIQESVSWLGSGDLWTLRDSVDMERGHVKMVGGSWECVYGGNIIAYRPDLGDAQRAVERAHDAACGAETE